MKKFLVTALILTVLSIPTLASADSGTRPIAPGSGPVFTPLDSGTRP